MGSVRWVGQNHGQKQVLSHKSQVRWSNPAPKSHKIIYDRYAKCLGVPKNPIPSPKRWKNDAPLCSPLFWWWLITCPQISIFYGCWPSCRRSAPTQMPRMNMGYAKAELGDFQGSLEVGAMVPCSSLGWYLVMTNIAMVKQWPIEIDGLAC